MYSYNQHPKGRGQTLATDASKATRGPQPMTNAFEDFGSDFKRASQSRSKPASSQTAAPGKGKGTAITFNDDSSDDEIDFLSGSSRHGSETPQRPRRTSKAPTAAEVPVVIDRHQADPNYRAIDLKKMKIPKKKNAAQTPENSQETRSPTSGAGQSSHPHPPPRSGSRAVSSAEPEKAKQRKKVPLRERSPNQDRSRPRLQSTPPREKGDHRKAQVKDSDMTPRPSRPAPRPVNKGARSSLGKSQTVPDLGVSSQEQDRSQPLSRSQSTRDVITIPSSSESDAPQPKEKRRGVYGKAKDKASKGNADPFRDISPLSSHIDKKKDAHDPEERSTRSKGQGKGKGKERADPIGALSPLKSSRSARKSVPSSFPMLSPLSSPATRHSSSPSRRNAANSQRKGSPMSSSDDEDDRRPRRGLRPFPMETQVLESIRNGAPTKLRTESDSSEDEPTGTYRKSRRRDSGKHTMDADSDSDDGSAYMRIYLSV